MNKYFIVAAIALLGILMCGCNRDKKDGNGGSIKLTPNPVDLSWEGQSVRITNDDWYEVYVIAIDESSRYTFSHGEAGTIKTSSADAEWVHWAHVEGDAFSTLSVDENLTGRVRTAYIGVTANDAYDRLNITQRPK